ncbi:MAG: hypothetical protein ABEJ73_00995 [Haloplanus sp.]
MSENTTPTETNRPEGNWAVEYDVEPIRIRDPVAEALVVLDPGEPFVVTYEDVVTAAGHSCPTASGAYRITQLGLDALYPDDYPVRSDIEVAAGGPRDDATYGLMSRLISYVTGVAQEDGFGGVGAGYGNRRNTLVFDAFHPESADPTFRVRRTDTGETVEVTYHVADVPGGGSALGTLQELIDGTASEEERRMFAEAWHGRVRSVLSDDSLFTVTTIED